MAKRKSNNTTLQNNDSLQPPLRISKLHKWYLKYTDRKAYDEYKQIWRDYKHALHIFNQEQLYKAKVEKLGYPSFNHVDKTNITFKHSGNSGDIIYALPTVFALAKTNHAHLLLHAHQKIEVQHNYKHSGNVMLSDKMIEMLQPLLLHQPQIKSVSHFRNEKVDYDLDVFRNYPLPIEKLCISRWYFYIFGVAADLSKPWLNAPKDEGYADYIVIARSHRHRAPNISYSFLKKYPKKLFIGIPAEFNEMQKEVPDIEYKPVEDFLEMAAIVNSCKFFIGNQSFPFSLAEALKVPRILELYFKAPNVVVQGYGGYDFLYQQQFENTVAELYESRFSSDNYSRYSQRASVSVKQ